MRRDTELDDDVVGLTRVDVCPGEEAAVVTARHEMTGVPGRRREIEQRGLGPRGHPVGVLDHVDEAFDVRAVVRRRLDPLWRGAGHGARRYPGALRAREHQVRL